jgi:hypothetical protein
MPNTLGLDDDLEPVEVVRHLERIFDVRVSNEEAERISNVGEFYDFLLDKIPSNDADRKCASAMTFYRIRSALRTLGYGDGLTLASDIHGLERGRTRKNLRDVERESGLRMPETVPTPIGRVGSLCGFVATLAGVFSLQPGLASAFLGMLAGLIAAGAILKYLDPGKLPANCGTLADITKMVAVRNYGRLVKMGARHSNDTVWETLVEALSHHALPKSEITRDTFFLQSQFE